MRTLAREYKFLRPWREKYHAINICEKKLSQRRKERKENARSKRF